MNVPVYVFEIKPEFSRLKRKQNYIHLVYLDMRESIWLIFLAYNLIWDMNVRAPYQTFTLLVLVCHASI